MKVAPAQAGATFLWKIAGDGEDGSYSQESVGGVGLSSCIEGREPGSACKIEQCRGEEDSGERVEVEGVTEVAVEQRGEGAGRSTARALQVKESVDGAARVERIAVGWEAQKQGAKGDRCDPACGRHRGDAAAGRQDHRAPR